MRSWEHTVCLNTPTGICDLSPWSGKEAEALGLGAGGGPDQER